MTVHIMVDLETRSSRLDAAIMSIGAVTFDPLGAEWLEASPKLAWDRVFSVNVVRESALSYGFHESAETMEWWKTQPAEAMDVATRSPVDLPVMLFRLNEWIRGLLPNAHPVRLAEGAIRIWSHATFDAAILNYTHQVMNVRPPWHYRDMDDLRTLQRLAFGYGKSGENVPIPDVGHAHEAVFDAWRQSMIVQACFDNIERRDGRTSV